MKISYPGLNHSGSHNGVLVQQHDVVTRALTHASIVALEGHRTLNVPFVANCIPQPRFREAGTFSRPQAVPRAGGTNFSVGYFKGEVSFTNPETGTRYLDVGHRFGEVSRKAGFSDVTFHTLRHTFASRLAQAGVPLNTIRELLGHGCMVMTMRYAHLAPNNLRDAVEMLPGRSLAYKERTNQGPGSGTDVNPWGVVRREGIEPTTRGLRIRCSTRLS